VSTANSSVNHSALLERRQSLTKHCIEQCRAVSAVSAVQCSAVQCSAVHCAGQCSAVQCSAVQCSAVQCSAVQCSDNTGRPDVRAWLRNPCIHCPLYTALHCPLHCTALSTALHCTVYCTALHCTIHCTVLSTVHRPHVSRLTVVCVECAL
jgi:hypothetical protein